MTRIGLTLTLLAAAFGAFAEDTKRLPIESLPPLGTFERARIQRDDEPTGVTVYRTNERQYRVQPDASLTGATITRTGPTTWRVQPDLSPNGSTITVQGPR
jgi:hypothetical protein